jgi:hypothetical protein
MWSAIPCLLLALTSAQDVAAGDDEKKVAVQETTTAVETRGMRVHRGEGLLPLWVPDEEKLDFKVILRMAVLGKTKVGTFSLSAGTEPFVSGLPLPGQKLDASKRVAWIRGEADGHYLAYSLEHLIETRMLPQEWPRTIYKDEQGGSENRKREVRYGILEGKPMSWYRRDSHCRECSRPEHRVDGRFPWSDEHHCKKCKRGEHRIWKDPETREIPGGALDMLSGIFLSRTMVREKLEEVSFPLLDKMKVWEVTLTRGKLKHIETSAGRFLCRQIELETGVPEGEEHSGEEFKGLFGIHGTIVIWVEEATGVPVKIQGYVPLGPFDLDVALELRKFTGTPEDFKPLPEEE